MADEKTKKGKKAPDDPEAAGAPPEGPGNDTVPSDGGEDTKSGKPKALPAALSKAIRYGIFGCLGLLVVGIGIWLAIVIPDMRRHAAHPPERTPEEIAREREARAKEAEKTATWQDAHCKMLHAYYEGPEPDLPEAELLGLPADADETVIRRRCADLLGAVRRLGGWPTAKPQQDNFVLCPGFRFELVGTFPLSVRTTPESLAADEILYGVPGDETYRQHVYTEYAVGIGTLTPMVVRTDDHCVAIGVERMGRRREIPGRIVREVPPE